MCYYCKWNIYIYIYQTLKQSLISFWPSVGWIDCYTCRSAHEEHTLIVGSFLTYTVSTNTNLPGTSSTLSSFSCVPWTFRKSASVRAFSASSRLILSFLSSSMLGPLACFLCLLCFLCFLWCLEDNSNSEEATACYSRTKRRPCAYIFTKHRESFVQSLFLLKCSYMSQINPVHLKHNSSSFFPFIGVS